MTINAIRKGLVDLILYMGQEAHPNEFAAFMVEEDGVLEELNLIPGTVGGSSSATVHFEMIPITLGVAGSVHSHPNGILRPSKADISFFGRVGSCHIIVGYPYEEGCFKAFHPNGSEYPLEVVD